MSWNCYNNDERSRRDRDVVIVPTPVIGPMGPRGFTGPTGAGACR